MTEGLGKSRPKRDQPSLMRPLMMKNYELEEGPGF